MSYTLPKDADLVFGNKTFVSQICSPQVAPKFSFVGYWGLYSFGFPDLQYDSKLAHQFTETKIEMQESFLGTVLLYFNIEWLIICGFKPILGSPVTVCRH
jgi:hypothetical protein